MDPEVPGGASAAAGREAEVAAPVSPAAEKGAQAGSVSGAKRSGGAAGLDFVLDVPLKLTVEIGGARMLVREILQLGKGSVVELDRVTGDPADVLVNDRLVARGEVTVIGDRLAVKVVEVIENHTERGGPK